MIQTRKNSYIQKLLLQSDCVFTIPVSKIVYCYNVYMEKFSNMSKSIENIDSFQGLPDQETIEGWRGKSRTWW